MSPGLTYPLGASVLPGGINFSVYSRYAKQVEILLFNDAGEKRPSRVYSLEARHNRTYDYWHAFVPGLEAGQIYAFRADGPFQPEQGLRFDADKVLLDPYGKCIARPPEYSREAARRPGDNCATALKKRRHRFEKLRLGRRCAAASAILEMRDLRDARRRLHQASKFRRGYRAAAERLPGYVEKIPYLKELGVTAVELLPVFAFDEQDAPSGLSNYWGYSPVSFFAPHSLYSSRKEPLGVLDEFRDLVKALHREGIEVILDVVYNHTAEGGHDGPTISFRGLANGSYYHLLENKALYADFTGCGNTINANQSVVRRMILDSLTYWVSATCTWTDFASTWLRVLSRDQKGAPDEGVADRAGHSIGSGAFQYQAHCRSVGCGWPLSGGQLRRLSVEGMERQISRRHPLIYAQRTRPHSNDCVSR